MTHICGSDGEPIRINHEHRAIADAAAAAVHEWQERTGCDGLAAITEEGQEIAWADVDLAEYVGLRVPTMLAPNDAYWLGAGQRRVIAAELDGVIDRLTCVGAVPLYVAQLRQRRAEMGDSQ